MWYRIRLAAADAGKLPLLRDSLEVQGPDLTDLIATVAMEVVGAVERLRGTEVPYLEGLLLMGAEVEVWASSSSCAASEKEAERFLRSTRQLLLDTHSCSSGPRKGGTLTGSSGSSPN